MYKFITTSLVAMLLAVSFVAVSYAQGSIGMSYPEKVRMLEQALSIDPGNANTLVQLGNAYYDWGFQEVNSKGKDAQPGYYWLKSIEYYGRALDKIPADANVRTDRANLLWYTGNIDEAISEYQKVKGYDPKHVQSRLNLVNILGQEKGDYKAAVKEYDELVEVSPNVGYDMGLKQTIDQYRSMANPKAPAKEQPSFQKQPEVKKDDPHEFKW